MWFLLACAAPGVELGVALPAAENAVAVPAERFVGPLDVTGVPTEALCGTPDRAALLAEGRYGWRVVVLDGAGMHAAGATEGWEATARRWREADAAVKARCGAVAPTAVLFAAHRDARFDASDVWAVHTWADGAGAGMFVLVEDGGAEERPPPGGDATEASGFVLARSRGGWAVLGPDAAVETASAREAGAWLATQGAGAASLSWVEPVAWAEVIGAADALVAHGIVPAFALTVPGKDGPAAPAPTRVLSPGSARVALADRLAVISLGDAYARRPLLMQVLGTSGTTSPAAEPGAPAKAPFDPPPATPFGASPPEPPRGPVR